MLPYLIMLAVEGIPIFYLELAVGQRLRKGAIGIWNQVTILAGITVKHQREIKNNKYLYLSAAFNYTVETPTLITMPNYLLQYIKLELQL